MFPSSSKKPGVTKSNYRSEEHTSELQSQSNLVCRLLLEKKKIKSNLYSYVVNSFDPAMLSVFYPSNTVLTSKLPPSTHIRTSSSKAPLTTSPCYAHTAFS